MPTFKHAAACHKRPCHPLHLVRDGNRGHPRRLSGEQRDEAWVDRAGLAPRISDRHQVAIALIALFSVAQLALFPRTLYTPTLGNYGAGRLEICIAG